MTQAPAVPKWHRVRMRLAARVWPVLARHWARTPSEHAALTLRAARLPMKPPQTVTFLIPLVGQHHVSDWDAVLRRLSSTLQSFQAQTNPNWRALICCQDKPDLPPDPRLIHVPFESQGTGNDKWQKLRHLCAQLPDLTGPAGYVMSFDADDLLHKTAVAQMLTQAQPGYLVEQGLVMDHASSALALTGRKTLKHILQKPFWKLCGSCMALYHDPEVAAFPTFFQEMTAHEHRMFPYLARLSGAALTPTTPGAVLYVLNHGENFGARRGRVGFKTRFVQKHRVMDPVFLKMLAEDFPRL